MVSRFAPLQKQALANTLRNTYFSILFDETTDVSSAKYLAMTVRYFDRILESKFLGLIEIPEATAYNIFEVNNKNCIIQKPYVN